MANKAQRSASLILAKEKMENEKKIANLNKEIEGLKEALEKELEWKPYEFSRNVSQKEYDKIAAEENMVRLNDEQCKNILSDWFGICSRKSDHIA